ncbi:amino acid ABC transporter permease [Candidatus Halobonum tyrrellensis]|uniref:Polar amino acid ABC transporter permease n=1 Tax=Candidatus Halobonum tyrrellensis G22 TaxID=1324957 RepID=V4J456_9EURY|nr:amino acid ABC transporter permease [Candidatus Halobonum tyrrellensis]ESP90157.1 polar amino acid ABC transporter permease [Candidatus Halobonum tyrrellensis G22]
MAERAAGTDADSASGSRARFGDRDVGTLATYLAGALFWGWIFLRWLNDWSGGVFVPARQAFVPPSLFRGVAAGVPVVGGAFEALAFAFEYAPALVNALWLTVVLTVVSIALGFVIAVPLAASRVYGRVSAWVSVAYIELLRGTPLLAQLFVLYYGFPWLTRFFRGLPGVGQGVLPGQAVFVAVIGFTLNSAAYQAEYIRGAIESVAPGQLVAARSVGLSRVEGVRFVVLPQALRYAIPGWTNELVYLVKYSSLAAFITVPELFRAAQNIASSNYRYTSMFVLAAVLYLGVVVTATNLMEYVGRRVAVPGISGGEGR